MSRDPSFVALCDDARVRVKEITVDQLADYADAVLIDVREEKEFEKSHIPGSIHVSKGLIEVNIASVCPDKNQTLILYCGGGNRSVLAADNVQKMGYTSVLSLKGGYRKWAAENQAYTRAT